jgi:hypothetical protein
VDLIATHASRWVWRLRPSRWRLAGTTMYAHILACRMRPDPAPIV